MPICIAGMHRSGTSMVARLLNLCGVYLGPNSGLSGAARDNEAGFWENPDFVRLNEKVLSELGGGWDYPPGQGDGWVSTNEMSRIKDEAAQLIAQFTPHAVWGWKDPRNSLLLPFWKRLIPDLKVVVCLRNPLEVATSLNKRSHSSHAFGLNLWLAYNQSVLSSTQPGERLVTHYNSYFYEPKSELRRVLSLLGVSTADGGIAKACSTVLAALRHSWVTTQELVEPRIPREVVECYATLCKEAGAIYDASAEKVTLLAKGARKGGGLKHLTRTSV